MASGTHNVVVWVGTKERETRLFTITARNGLGATARLPEVEGQVAEAGFVEVLRETGLTKQQANARKAALRAEYEREGFTYQPRRSLPQPMK